VLLDIASVLLSPWAVADHEAVTAIILTPRQAYLYTNDHVSVAYSRNGRSACL